MADERSEISPFDLLRWLLPVAVVVLGIVLFFMYHAAAPAMGMGAGL